MVALLEAVESSYSPAMSSMQQDVRAGSGAQSVSFVVSYLVVESCTNLSSLASAGRGEGHLHLPEAAAASVREHGERRVSRGQRSDRPLDAHRVPGVGQLQILLHAATPHCSAAGDLQPPRATGQPPSRHCVLRQPDLRAVRLPERSCCQVVLPGFNTMTC